MQASNHYWSADHIELTGLETYQKQEKSFQCDQCHSTFRTENGLNRKWSEKRIINYFNIFHFIYFFLLFLGSLKATLI